MAQLRIRQTDDLELIAELDIQLFSSEPLREGDDLLNDSVWWVAEAFIEGEWAPVGYAGLEVTDNGKKAFLSRAGVLPVARGQRLQQRLLRARIKYARAHGVERVWTYTHWANVRCQRSLVKVGMLPYYWEREAQGNGQHLHFLYFEMDTRPKKGVASTVEAQCSEDFSRKSLTPPSTSTASRT